MNKNLSEKDKKDWDDFLDSKDKIEDKDSKELKFKKLYKEQTIDLHGYSLDDANEKIKILIPLCYENNISKINIITGKGSRSKSYENPYLSENLSVLKNSVPEYIRNDENLSSIISKITQASPKDGGEGAINIFLKNNKKFIK